MKLHVHKSEEVVVLHLRGRIVNGESHILRNAVSSLSDTNAVVLDFAQVSGIDAHGLGVLLDLRQQLQSKGVDFRLMNVTNPMRQVLAITKLDTVFEFTTEAETSAVPSSAESAEVKAVAMACD